MAAFPAANTLSTASSLSYHHLLSNGTNRPHQNSNSTSPNENVVDASIIINEIPPASLYDAQHTTDLSFCLPSSSGAPQPNFFDVPIPTSHGNNDPLVRHFFNHHHRPNDANTTGNYYSNMSTGPFVNTFEYSYPNTASASLVADAAVPNHSFGSTLQHAQQHQAFAHPYMSYPAPSQQQQQQQQQNIYPWMRRLHHGCGGESFPSFVYIRTSTLLYGPFMSLFLAREGEIYGHIPIGTNESNVYTCERNDASRCRWSEERLATTTRGSFDVKCVRDRCPCRDAIEQDRWRHSCPATDRLFRFADRRDKTNTNVLLEISNVGAREGVSFQSVSAIHGSAGRSQSLPARYLSRRRRIEIAHNLVADRTTNQSRTNFIGRLHFIVLRFV